MRVLILGDLFMTNEILKEAMDNRFKDSRIEIEYAFHTDNWPVEPLQVSDEVAEYCGSDDDIVPLVGDVEVIITHTGCITRKVVEAAPQLKVVALARGGPVNVNKEACTERKIPIIYAPGRNSGAVAEFTVGMILALTRKIAFSHYWLRYCKEWRGDLYAAENVGNELSCSTVGFIGFGAIGRKVAKVMAGFGSTIMIYDPYLSDEVRQSMPDFTFVDFETVLRGADIISLHAKLTPETAGMIGGAEISLMKKNAVLINTARGQLVDYEALYKALEEKRIAGAALDVFEDEPPPGTSKLFTLDNVVATPHLGGASIEAAKIGAAIAADEVYRYIVEGEAPRFWYNKF